MNTGIKKFDGMLVEKFDFNQIYDIKNPAYVIERKKENWGGKSYVILWNREFEKMTNFEPFEIDHAPCYKLINCVQKNKDNNLIKICGKNCVLSNWEQLDRMYVLSNAWINSRYREGFVDKKIKRLVDIYIFPFMPDNRDDKAICSLRILINKGKILNYDKVKEGMMGKSEKQIIDSLRKRIESSPQCMYCQFRNGLCEKK